MEPVVLAPYSDRWPETFLREREALQRAFRSSVVAVEHIGSTSVPGMAAKPVIDILLGVDALATIERHADALRLLAYRYVPEVEAALPMRRYFVKPGAGPAAFHLHGVEQGASFWREHLAFRDALREDGALARDYLALKRSLAARFTHDRDRYTEGKAAFIREAVRRRLEGGRPCRSQTQP